MQTARRVYIYLVSYISLVITMVAAANLLGILSEMTLGTQQIVIEGTEFRDRVSLWAATLIVGGVVWAVHWTLAQRGVSEHTPEAEQERTSVFRKLMVYAALFTTLWMSALALHELLFGTQLLIFAPDGSTFGDVFSTSIPQLLVYGLAGLYYWWVRRTDNALSPEEGYAATVRRWYFYLVNFIALTALMATAAAVARNIWQTAASSGQLAMGTTEWSRFIIETASWLVIVAGIWLLHWLPMQRLTSTSSDEQHSILRKIYLYGVILETVIVSVTGISLFAYNLLRWLIGTGPLIESGETEIAAIGSPLLTALVYGAFWAYHWRVIGWDVSLMPAEQLLQASIRRIYYYLVAIVGLGVLATGVTGMLRLLFDFWLGGTYATELSSRVWGDQISLFATLLLAGGSVWLVHWLHMQRLVLAPDGDEERQSLPRRIYLYLVLFAGVIALLGGASWLLYTIFRNIGETFTPGMYAQMSWALGISITAAVGLAYHAWVMLGDQRARAALPALTALPVAGGAMLVLVRGEDASTTIAAVTAFESDLPDGVQAEVFDTPDMTPAELKAWLAARRTQMARPAPPPTQQTGQQQGTQPMPA